MGSDDGSILVIAMKFKRRTTPRWKQPFGVSVNHRYKSLERAIRRGLPGGRRLESGYFVGPTWYGLEKAWFAYVIGVKLDQYENRKYYAAVIQKLERELEIQEYSFEEIKQLAADFLDEYRDDPVVQGMTIEEIEELMRKHDDTFWSQVND